VWPNGQMLPDEETSSFSGIHFVLNIPSFHSKPDMSLEKLQQLCRFSILCCC